MIIRTKERSDHHDCDSRAIVSSSPTKIQIFSKNTGVRPFFTPHFTQYYI